MSDASKKIISELLNKHLTWVNGIADLIRNSYESDDDKTIRYTLNYVKKDESFFNNIKSTAIGDKKKAIENLRNCWYHEAAFLEASGYGEIKFTKFLPWKIIQFYYSVYTGLSALVRCVRSDPKLGQKAMINIFTHEILCKKGLSQNLFLSPFCFVLVNNIKIIPPFEKVVTWKHGLDVKCPQIEICLRDTSNTSKVSLFHYFWSLRNWANYEDSYIFRKLYGKIIRPAFYRDLNCILSLFISLTEIFMIWVCGLDMIRREKDLFIRDFNNYFEYDVDEDFKVTKSLRKRFEYYENFKTSSLR